MTTDLFEIFVSEVTLVIPIILFEDGSNFLFRLVEVRLSIHSPHKLNKTQPPRLLIIKLRNNLINSLLIGIEPILRKQQFQIIR